MIVGCIIGLVAGCFIAITLIFPSDILNTTLANLTVGDILRLIEGGILTIILTYIGGLIGLGVKKNDIK